MLCMSELYANQYMYFIDVPPSVPAWEAIIVLKEVALKRRWNITEQDKETLQITLNHKDYRAVLDFNISNGKVFYLDSTTYLTDTIFTDFDEEGEWLKKAAPINWMRNLENDANRALRIRDSYKNTGKTTQSKDIEDIESKLERLKRLFNKKLITELEYNAKRKEIISEY